MLNHTSLEVYYHTTFSLVQHHKYSLTEIENMIPYELDIYLEFLMTHIKEQEAKMSNK
ncbi:hypothetical protein UFOVP410_105 [uncultured Caudovirales phage]|uniref:Uncharacterized protein n=1 Tax=uncultured Caudovirales phage TaxID=2100421 RepID=A0A6J5M849_9CAUD|nr:hypothetical protein UFOVP410_105 [uncultured Caudovirales phage]